MHPLMAGQKVTCHLTDVVATDNEIKITTGTKF